MDQDASGGDACLGSTILKQMLMKSPQDLRLGWRFTFQQNDDSQESLRDTCEGPGADQTEP